MLNQQQFGNQATRSSLYYIIYCCFFSPFWIKLIEKELQCKKKKRQYDIAYSEHFHCEILRCSKNHLVIVSKVLLCSLVFFVCLLNSNFNRNLIIFRSYLYICIERNHFVRFYKYQWTLHSNTILNDCFFCIHTLRMVWLLLYGQKKICQSIYNL